MEKVEQPRAEEKRDFLIYTATQIMEKLDGTYSTLPDGANEGSLGTALADAHWIIGELLREVGPDDHKVE